MAHSWLDCHATWAIAPFILSYMYVYGTSVAVVWILWKIPVSSSTRPHENEYYIYLVYLVSNASSLLYPIWDFCSIYPTLYPEIQMWQLFAQKSDKYLHSVGAGSRELIVDRAWPKGLSQLCKKYILLWTWRCLIYYPNNNYHNFLCPASHITEASLQFQCILISI